MAAAQQGAGADEGARRKILGEICAIGSVEFVQVSEVRAINLNVDEVVHGHTCSAEGGFVSVEKLFDFIFHFLGPLPCVGVEANLPAALDRAPGKAAVAEAALTRLA